LVASCAKILEKMKFTKELAQIGHTKVFLRDNAAKMLEKEKATLMLKYVAAMQKAIRTRLSVQVAFIKTEKIRLWHERIIWEETKAERERLEKERKEREERERKEREERERREREERE